MVSYEKAQSETMTNSEFDGKTHLSGTTSQRGSTTKWPTSMPFYDTDLKRWYKNTGTESVPVSSEIGGDGSAYDIVYPLSVTIGDYTLTPAAATATSTNSGSSIPWDRDFDFTEYADQTAFDAAWVPSGSTIKGSPTNDRIDFDTNGVQVCYYDFGSNISDSAWINRFKLTLTTTGVSLGILWCIWSTNTSNAQTSDSHLGCYLYDADNNVKALGDLARRPDQTLNEANLSPAISPSNTTYYVEMKRTSTTSFTVTFYSDSAYSSSLGTATLTVDAGIVNLRYFKILGYTSGAMIGHIDDWQFENGSSSVPAVSPSVTYDGDTSTYWKSNSEANPAIYWDFTSNRKFISFALNLNTTDTTVSTMELSLSTDTTFSGEVKRTLLESDFTNNTWRYILINIQATDTRYVQLKGSGTGVLAVYEFKARATTDTSPGFGHYHKVISTSATSASVNDSN